MLIALTDLEIFILIVLINEQKNVYYDIHLLDIFVMPVYGLIVSCRNLGCNLKSIALGIVHFELTKASLISRSIYLGDKARIGILSTIPKLNCISAMLYGC